MAVVLGLSNRRSGRLPAARPVKLRAFTCHRAALSVAFPSHRAAPKAFGIVPSPSPVRPLAPRGLCLTGGAVPPWEHIASSVRPLSQSRLQRHRTCDRGPGGASDSATPRRRRHRHVMAFQPRQCSATRFRRRTCVSQGGLSWKESPERASGEPRSVVSFPVSAPILLVKRTIRNTGLCLSNIPSIRPLPKCQPSEGHQF